MNDSHVDTLSQVRISKHAMWRRRATALLCAFSLTLQQACYNTIPVAGAATMPAGPVRVVVNDRGRILIGGKLGSLVEEIEGRIVKADANSVEIAVQTAEDARGKMARWGGERVTIPREGIESITEKKVSRVRSFLLFGGIVVGLATVLLLAKGSKSGQNGKIDPGPDPI